jgi:glycerophosphoryl diester phosphodiesterase
MSLTLPRYIAHRGASAVAPENTLAAFRKAAELGATWVEFDAMLTADAFAVVHHDDDLKRIAGIERAMDETSFAKLTAINAKLAEPIPSLAETLDLLGTLGLSANIEIKPTPGRTLETAERVLVETAARWRGGEAPLISSFEWEALAVAQSMQPDWPRGLLIDFRDSPDADWRGAAKELGAYSLHLDGPSVTAGLVAEAKALGLKVLVYTVNQPDQARALWAVGVDCIFTDRVAEMAALA